jgi:uncharacterized protein YkwD
MIRTALTFVKLKLPAAMLLAAMLMAHAAEAAPSAELTATIKAKMLSMINAERREFGLAPVRVDPLASVVADALCRRQVYDRSVGHFSTDGLAPYHRYSFAGGLDGVTENTAAWSRDTPYGADEIDRLVEESVRTMLHEGPPDDGHRRAILDPHATHVGLGFAWRDGEVRIAQEFVRRYLHWTLPPPRELREGAKAVCAAKPAAGWEIAAISVHYEPAPKFLSRAEASRIESYDLPATRSDFKPRSLRDDSPIVRSARAAGGAPGDLAVADDGAFTFSIPFEHGPGLYTVVAWLRKGDTVTTASNVVVRVRERREARGERR